MKRIFEEMIETVALLARLVNRDDLTGEAIENISVILPDEMIQQLELESSSCSLVSEPLKVRGLKVIAASEHK